MSVSRVKWEAFCDTLKQAGELLTAGGRVLAVVAQGDDFDAAFAGAYNGLNQLDYAGITYRRDIGHQVRSGG